MQFVGALAPRGQYAPPPQSMHAVAPLVDWYVPATQIAQLLWPTKALNEPGLHAVAAVARRVHRLPVGHAMHTDAPMDGWYVPALHWAQSGWLLLPENVPPSHG
jgi:hypothetical protein